jgi:hypothetical protein
VADSRPCGPSPLDFRKARVNDVKRTLHLLPCDDEGRQEGKNARRGLQAQPFLEGPVEYLPASESPIAVHQNTAIAIELDSRDKLSLRLGRAARHAYRLI